MLSRFSQPPHADKPERIGEVVQRDHGLDAAITQAADHLR